MIVDCHRKNTLGAFLTHHIFIEMAENLLRRRYFLLLDFIFHYKASILFSQDFPT
jgi:hypothetical protein